MGEHQIPPAHGRVKRSSIKGAFGFGAKKDRGRGFSGLTAREMKREPFFARSLTLVPRFLLLNRTETLATQAGQNAVLS